MFQILKSYCLPPYSGHTVTLARGTKKIPHSQKFSVVSCRPNFALYKQKMNRTTINQAPRTPSEDREGHEHYFTLARAKVNLEAQFNFVSAWE